ncbi:hypothetical protein Fleli_0831 [Bernardetia litoralis DSM 6794]|uniref:FG-GAP repeat protein n=1 Tax=Bernardetia litoralis (strain ATCC 23117 / DSM 6794 / NBRC 15988 / NCIMB 1366 / Fx l1 / Sio-4) TaxID=880071 RepID=I4AH54_BERLS|nr:hypothetical protein [Bernardetia litoralis]AFM03289.1 hypothetical protein Fleli_0831 [Bernardetia litoralis DSM 6794]
MKFHFHFIYFLFLIFLLSNCQNKEKDTFYTTLKDKQEIGIRLIKKKSKKHKHNFVIQTFLKKDTSIILDEWKLPYDIYNFDVADADNDGQDDIWVGVIKETRFDKHMKKRLFLFKIIEGKIRPLWLGSRLSKPLVNFLPAYLIDSLDKTNKKCIIKTIEQEKNGTFLVANYRWKRFGVEFINYEIRETDSLTASKLLIGKP